MIRRNTQHNVVIKICFRGDDGGAGGAGAGGADGAGGAGGAGCLLAC